MYSTNIDASTSSREKPHVVWVRSFVPKEKKSALAAMRPAVSAARGSSIIVPIGMVISTPASVVSFLISASASSRTMSSSRTEPTSGTMISTFGSLPAFFCAMAASVMARICRPGSPGVSRPSRTPRRPSIGFASCSRCTAASSRVSASTFGAGVAVIGFQRDPDGQFGQVRQELVQRRVEQPNGDRQPVHRIEDLDEVLALQRQQRVESLLAIFETGGQDERLDQCATRAEEHVLGAAQADALRRPACGRGWRPQGCRRSPGRRAGAPRRRASAPGRRHAPAARSPRRHRSTEEMPSSM